jgi:hypothetical protein
LVANDGNESHRILFSGNLGRYDDAIMKPPAAVTMADTLVVESTYGGFTAFAHPAVFLLGYVRLADGGQSPLSCHCAICPGKPYAKRLMGQGAFDAILGELAMLCWQHHFALPAFRRRGITKKEYISWYKTLFAV